MAYWSDRFDNGLENEETIAFSLITGALNNGSVDTTTVTHKLAAAIAFTNKLLADPVAAQAYEDSGKGDGAGVDLIKAWLGAVDANTGSAAAINEISTVVDSVIDLAEDSDDSPGNTTGYWDHSGLNAIYGTNDEDELMSTGSNDIVYGLGGDDVLFGGAGNNTYYFARGDGADTIIDAGGEKDVIEFAPGITPADIRLTHSFEPNSDEKLILSIKGSTDQIDILAHYAINPITNNNLAIEELHFADGTNVDLIGVGSALQEGQTVDLIALL